MKTDMKMTEDIEKLTLADLERIADDESIAVPEHLGERIENRILASEILRSDSPEMANDEPRAASGNYGATASGNSRRPSVRIWKRIVPVFVAAAVAAVVIGLNLHHASVTPADTFSSPEEAYAQVERTFAMIGSKVGKGKSIADAALPHMQKASRLIGNVPPSSFEGGLYSK